ncbi:outer membrane protein assembly factor BamD [Thiofilum flexile]|uniref:outer membrane protein assembly factor BamD n=1 Tax=Thiofilum flexile TaxID=125627 RepID=UPI001FE001B4|nr:outer membrane protein assembly factor BamD [Thiofilum flexile]
MSITTKMFKMHLRRSYTVLFAVVLAMVLGACSSQSSKETPKVDPNNSLTADQLYSKAQKATKSGDYKTAISLFETLEARFPLGPYAQQAQLEAAYAYYKYDEPDSALDAIDRFVRMNPMSNKLDYALYLRGLVNFNRGSSLVDKVFPRSIADLDIVRQKEAFQDFSTLINRFPNSRYTGDAKQRVQYLRNTLAYSEVNVAKYYMEREAWLAAFNRAEYAIKHYQGSPAVIDALEIKIVTARKMGKPDLAADNLKVLEANFPERAAKFR